MKLETPLYRLLTVLLIGVCCITCSEVVAKEQKETNAYERDFKHGNDLLVLGKYQQAADKFTNCLSIDPLNEYAYFARCVCYTRLGMYDNAIEDAQKALKLNPADILAYEQLAEMFHEQKDYLQAIKVGKSGLLKDPQNVFCSKS